MVTSVNPHTPAVRSQNGEQTNDVSVNGELTPNEIGMEFVRQYYTLMNEAPEHLYRLYSKGSMFVHGNITGKHQNPIVGQENIKAEIERLNFQHVYTKIRQVDCYSTLYDLLIVLICGDISILKTPARRFAQQIVLAPQGHLKYYVVNDIFRYIDEGDDHIDNDMETESSSEGAEEDIAQQLHQQRQQVAPEVLTGASNDVHVPSAPHVMPDQHQMINSATVELIRQDIVPNVDQVGTMDPVVRPGMQVSVVDTGMQGGHVDETANVQHMATTGMIQGVLAQNGTTDTTIMGSFNNVPQQIEVHQANNIGGGEPNGVVDSSSFMQQKKGQGNDEMFDAAPPENHTSNQVAPSHTEEPPQMNQPDNSSDVGISIAPPVEPGVKTWASITGALSGSPAKKSHNEPRMNHNHYQPPPQQSFQVQHANAESFGTAHPPKPQRNSGGGRNQHGDPNLVSPPTEPRAPHERRSGGGRNNGGQSSGGNQSAGQSQQMNIGTFSPKSESPSTKFQGSGSNPPFNRAGGGGGSASGTFGGPNSFQQAPDDCQIFVGNLPTDVHNEELRKRFSEYGVVTDVRINRGGAVPFGFVVFDSVSPVQAILAKTQGPERQTLFLRNDKHRINIEEKKPRGVTGGGNINRGSGGRYPPGVPGKAPGPRDGGGGSNNKFFKSGSGPSGGGGGKNSGGASGNKFGGQFSAANASGSASNNNSNANINNSNQMQGNSFHNAGGRR